MPSSAWKSCSVLGFRAGLFVPEPYTGGWAIGELDLKRTHSCYDSSNTLWSTLGSDPDFSKARAELDLESIDNLYAPFFYKVMSIDEFGKEAGKKFLVKNAGYLAIDSLRIEKRNLLWGSDMTPEFNPFEAGLGFVVSKKKDKFIGKCALDKVREEGVKQKLCCFTMEEELQFFGSETIRCDGKIVGRVTTGAFGYTVGKSIALGYLPIGYAEKENFEIKVFNKKYHATRHDKVLYDSARKCMLA